MFCVQCGKEMTEGQRFCAYCGNGVEVVPKAQSASVSGEIDRHALIIYLENVRNLQFTKNAMEKERAEIQNRISRMGYRYQFDRKTYSYRYELLFLFIAITMIFLGVAGMDIRSVAGFCNFLFFSGLLMAVISGSILVTKILLDMNRYKTAIEQQEQRLMREAEEKEGCLQRDRILEDELHTVEGLLTEAYAVNWIPLMCRNVYGAHFLYDYISTSRVSLTEALLFFNLDSIKKTLDAMLETTQQIAVETARSNALKEVLVSQNNELIASAIRQEKNLNRIAELQQVSNSYLHSINYFQTMEYLDGC